MEKFNCPIDCPNRKVEVVGKGYSFLFSITLTLLLAWQSVDVKYARDSGWEMKTRDVPVALLIPSLLLIAGALGINTDPIAERIGKLVGGKE